MSLVHHNISQISRVYDGSGNSIGSSAGALNVNIGADVTSGVSSNFLADVTVQNASLTVDAGTNLNTSALALESGGNLADIKTAVELLNNCVSGSEMQVDIVSAPTLTCDVSTIPIAGSHNNASSAQLTAGSDENSTAVDCQHVSHISAFGE